MEINKIIAVILAVFLHHANGRAITATNKNNTERMLDLTEEELNMVLNETNQDPTERGENPADVLRLSEPDSPSHEVFSSDNMIQLKEASPVLRQKRSLANEPECYSGFHQTVQLPNTGLTIAYPVCRKVAQFTACTSSMANNNNKRKCKPSNHKYYPLDKKYVSTGCSCAA